ncbi:MAG: hypothetical protein IIA11_04750 [Proteobacteria bacterium]|nr:hypothetical protein [Pseudomonadota bacterium]
MSGGITATDRNHERAMRRRIIEELTYPRMMLLANLAVEECPQNRYFNPARSACQNCEQGEECHWLNCNDDFSVLARMPMKALLESILFCIDYVDAESTRANHNVKRCACESCAWVRKARRLAREYSDSAQRQ